MIQDNALNHISMVDNVLNNIINTIELSKVNSTNNVFHDLMSCVIEQQIHYRSTKKIFQKMLDASGIEVLTPHNFDEFNTKSLNHSKISNQKFETVMQVVEFWKTNTIHWESLTDEEVKTTLSQIKGIGNWSIDMILLYTLRRINIFPVDDFHLKQIMVDLYGLNPNVKLKAQMISISKEWGNYKSIAVLYLFVWKEMNRKGFIIK